MFKSNRVPQFVLLFVFFFVVAVANLSPVQAAIGQGGCARVYNSNSSGGLAVRVVPSTSGTIIRRISDGTVVRITGSSIYFGGYTWWPHNKGGWSAGSYLQEVSCSGQPTYSVSAQLSQYVQLTNGTTVIASNLTGSTPVQWMNTTYGKPGQFPLAAPITSMPGMRSASLYQAIIYQFASQYNARYTPSGGWTYCNTFAGDVMRAMGVSLPVKSSSDPATQGATNLYNWLKQGNGWTRIYPNSNSADLTRLISHVNAGYPALVATSGHIAVIRPYQTTGMTNFRNLRLAQAGATNSSNIALSTVWPSTPSGIAFFIRN